jgi:hypothetical protein
MASLGAQYFPLAKHLTLLAETLPEGALEAFRAIRRRGGRMVGIQLTLATALESTTL